MFKINHVTFDCADTYTLSRFWHEVTGFAEDPAYPNLPGNEEAYLGDPEGGASLLFIAVPEPKSVKNRVHLDLWPTQRTRDEEVVRLLGIGATVVEDHRRPDGRGWVTMADLDGNEFCVERGAAERAAEAAATATATATAATTATTAATDPAATADTDPTDTPAATPPTG